MKNYTVREHIPEYANEKLAEYPELMRTLLFYRGIDTRQKAEEFLMPNYDTGLHDPFLMKDMTKAVRRIIEALQTKERILVYSDYDADGIPAAVIMHDFFRGIGYEHFEIYIPHRHNEGYGLHIEAIETFKEKNITLLITLDCGITDLAEVIRAQALGIDVIVTDHHLPGEKLPDAFAVINAKQQDCRYPYDMLCGAAVAFKLAQAVITTLPLEQRGVFRQPGAEKWLLDMVGIATLSDMVPLQGENRIFAHYGLKVLRKTRRLGLLKFFSIIKLKPAYLTEDDIGFMITPRINAASRMGIPMDAFHLLSTVDEVEAGMLATQLDHTNNERKGLVASLVKEIRKILSEREEHFRSKYIIVVGNPNWRPALLGLVANTIAQDYKRPVFLWGREDGKEIKGSCRSDGTVDVVQLMEKSKEAFIEFGGHSFSGGYALHHDKVHLFEDILQASYKELGTAKVEEKLEPIDAVVTIDDITWKMYDMTEKLSPFGIGNQKPLFLFKALKPEEVKKFGKAHEHLEISFKNSRNKIIKAIGFFMNPEDFSVSLKKDVPINLIATLEKSMFRNFPELRLRIVDIM